MTFDSIALSNFLLACIAIVNLAILGVFYKFIRRKYIKERLL
jgi:hypothetical protein